MIENDRVLLRTEKPAGHRMGDSAPHFSALEWLDSSEDPKSETGLRDTLTVNLTQSPLKLKRILASLLLQPDQKSSDLRDPI